MSVSSHDKASAGSRRAAVQGGHDAKGRQFAGRAVRQPGEEEKGGDACNDAQGAEERAGEDAHDVRVLQGIKGMVRESGQQVSRPTPRLRLTSESEPKAAKAAPMVCSNYRGPKPGLK